MRRRKIHAIVGAAAIAAAFIAGSMEVETERAQVREYCSMVALWHETKGEAGWPPFNGEDVCKEAQR